MSIPTTLETSPLAARFAVLAQTQPMRLAIRFNGQLYDYSKFWRRVERTTAHLIARWNIGVGDRVAYLGLNHDMQLVTLLACARLGAIFMPMDSALTFPALQLITEDAGPALLLFEEPFSAIVRKLGCPGLRRTPLDTLIDKSSPRGLSLPVANGDMDVLFVHSATATGRLKGRGRYSQAALVAKAEACLDAQALSNGDHVLSVLPLSGIDGLCIQTLPALLAGAAVTLHARFDAAHWLAEVGLLRPTLSLLEPAAMCALNKQAGWADASLGSLRTLVSGSAISSECLQAFSARSVPVRQLSGSISCGAASVLMDI